MRLQPFMPTLSQMCPNIRGCWRWAIYQDMEQSASRNRGMSCIPQNDQSPVMFRKTWTCLWDRRCHSRWLLRGRVPSGARRRWCRQSGRQCLRGATSWPGSCWGRSSRPTWRRARNKENCAGQWGKHIDMIISIIFYGLRRCKGNSFCYSSKRFLSKCGCKSIKLDKNRSIFIQIWVKTNRFGQKINSTCRLYFLAGKH